MLKSSRYQRSCIGRPQQEHSVPPASCSKVQVGQASVRDSFALRRLFLTFDPTFFFVEPLPLATMMTSSCAGRSQLRPVTTCQRETHVVVDVHPEFLLLALEAEQARPSKALLTRLLPTLRSNRGIDRIVQLVETDVVVHLDFEKLEECSTAQTERIDRLVVVELSSFDEEALVNCRNVEAAGDLRCER